MSACGRWFATVLVVLPAVSGCLPVAAGGREPAVLSSLVVAPESGTTDYSRERFPHWIDQGGGCDTREYVLRRQGAAVVTDGGCKAVSGRWVSVYDDTAVTDAGGLDVDHVVPLAEAWRSGAASWSEDRRRAFANDVDGRQLVAVSARSNRAKGDQDPAEWMPVAGYRCAYVADWIAVKAEYGLTVDRAEHDALATVVAGCPH